MNNKRVNPKLLTHELQIIKLTVKRLRNTKFYAVFLISVMLVGIFSLYPAISSLMNDVIIRSTGRIATATTAPLTYKSEIRGVFVHAASMVNPDWDVIAETLKQYKINVVYGEFLGFGGGYYGDSPYGDQLGLAIKALHSRGIEVHVAMTFFYVVPENHHELHAVNHNGNPYAYWISPTKQGTLDVIKTQLEEVATNYDIDGFMFDYIRYDNTAMCYSNESKAKFEQWLGETITNWPGDFAPEGPRYKEFMEWRTVPITEIVINVRDWLLAIKPDLEFSVAAWTLFQDSPTYWRYYIGQDTAYWVAKGYLDLVAPMMYTTKLTGPDSIEDYIQSSRKYMTGGIEGKVPLVALITTGTTSPVEPTSFKAVVDKVREMGADGWIIWRYGGPGDGQGSNSPDIRNYLSIIDVPDVFSVGNIQVSTSETQATITWNTDLPAISKVEYSTSPLFNASFKYSGMVDFHYWDIDHVAGTIVENNTTVTNHNITLTDLLPETKYYFRVQSEDSGGIATSKVLTFTTES